jgi:flavin-dependent dehydrogenase
MTVGSATVRRVRCVVAGGSLVGLSLAIALSELGMKVTVLERSPAPAVEVGGGLGVDIDLLRQVTGIREEPPALHGIDRDTTAWHLLQGWLEAHAVRRPGVSVHRGTEVTTVLPGNDHQPARVVAAGGGGKDCRGDRVTSWPDRPLCRARLGRTASDASTRPRPCTSSCGPRTSVSLPAVV